MRYGKISLIGAYPPPYGGHSVHIARLADLLYNRQYDVHIFDFYGKKEKNEKFHGIHLYRFSNIKIWRYLYLTLKLLMNSHTVYHFHVSHFNKLYVLYPLIVLLAYRSGKKIITIHSGDFAKLFSESQNIRKRILLRILNLIDCIICVGVEQKKSLERMNISGDKIYVIPAFLPPVAKATKFIEEKINDLKAKVSTILLVSGYAMELYGFHIVYAALSELRKEGVDIGLIISLYSGSDKEYLEKLRNLTNSDKLTVFLNDLNPEQFSYLLSIIDIYIRPTDRDGDAVTVREAGYFNKQVIASDCVKRPSGCLLFKTNDVADLKESIKKAIADKALGIMTERINESDIIEVYRSISMMKSFPGNNKKV